MNKAFHILIVFLLISVTLYLNVGLLDTAFSGTIITFVMLGIVTAYILFVVERKRLLKIQWLTRKVDELKDILSRKDIVEKRIVNDLPIGIIIYNSQYQIKWANGYSKDIFENVLETRSIRMISSDIYDFLTSELRTSDVLITKIYSQEYEVEVDRKERIIYLVRVTEREELKRRYEANLPVIAMIHLDNLEDALGVLDVSKQSFVQGLYFAALEAWGEEFGFYITPLSNSKMVAFMNKKSLQNLIKNEFKIVEKIAGISKQYEVLVTLSAGIACSNIRTDKLGDIASEALELALSRGGDQVVVNIEGYDLMYFGGNTNTAEKRTRITARTNMQKLEKLMEETDKVLIMPHRHPDTDALGASMGVLKLAQSYNKEAYIILDRDDLDKAVVKTLEMIELEYITFLDYIISPSKALEIVNKTDLLIIVDHHSYSQTLEEKLIGKTKHLAIIDHHRKLSDAIEKADINYIEPYASSSVELVVELIDLSAKDVELNKLEATVMLSGIIVDTNNYVYRTGSRTFEASAYLRKFGAEPIRVKTILREGLDEIQLKSELLTKTEVYYDQFAIVLIPEEFQPTRSLLAKVADDLLEIDNIVAGFALGYLDNETVGISARSLEGFNVQLTMEKFNGGGHLNNAGAQIVNADILEVKTQLVKLLEEHVLEEKQMKVILIKDLKGKGKKGDVIEVASGYANYLLSSKNAIEATAENLQSIEMEKARQEELEKRQLEEMRELKQRIERLPVKVFVKIGENGKLFGTVNSKQIAQAYKQQHNISFDKRKILLKEHISTLGNYKVDIRLHKNVIATVEVHVVEE